MEIYLNEQPSAPLAGLALMSAVRVTPAVDIPWRCAEHQAQAQFERAAAPVFLGVDETNGFTGMDMRSRNKRTDVRGVPPRGRPV